MAVVKCKECKKEVSNSAKTCPHCGISNPGLDWKAALGGFALLGGICLIVAMFVGGKDETSKTTASVPVQAETPAAVTAVQSIPSEPELTCYEVGSILGQCEKRQAKGILCGEDARISVPQKCEGTADLANGMKRGRINGKDERSYKDPKFTVAYWHNKANEHEKWSFCRQLYVDFQSSEETRTKYPGFDESLCKRLMGMMHGKEAQNEPAMVILATALVLASKSDEEEVN